MTVAKWSMPNSKLPEMVSKNGANNYPSSMILSTNVATLSHYLMVLREKRDVFIIEKNQDHIGKHTRKMMDAKRTYWKSKEKLDELSWGMKKQKVPLAT
jgi:hypothetical protein